MMFAKEISVNCTFSDEYEGNLEQSFALPLMADFEGIMFDDIAALTPGDTLLRKEMHKRIDSIANDMAFIQGYSGGAVVNSVSMIADSPKNGHIGR